MLRRPRRTFKWLLVQVLVYPGVGESESASDGVCRSPSLNQDHPSPPTHTRTTPFTFILNNEMGLHSFNCNSSDAIYSVFLLAGSAGVELFLSEAHQPLQRYFLQMWGWNQSGVSFLLFPQQADAACRGFPAQTQCMTFLLTCKRRKRKDNKILHLSLQGWISQNLIRNWRSSSCMNDSHKKL